MGETVAIAVTQDKNLPETVRNGLFILFKDLCLGIRYLDHICLW